MILLYQIFIRSYVLALRLAALWNPKAGAWVQGRKDLFARLQQRLDGRPVIWMHCASAGELEQGKPLLEALRTQYPGHQLLVSFFSPSGYAAGEKYKGADAITYLPLDTRARAERFIATVNPALVIFVKYEFWYHHLNAMARRNIPLVLVCAIFRKNQVFFKWYGGFYRRMLFLFQRLFVQDLPSCQLLASENIHHCTVAGDTRFDRVHRIAAQFTELPLIAQFVAGNNDVIVAGSTWPEDEALLAHYISSRSAKLVLAPHEIGAQHLAQIRKLFPKAVFYSELQDEPITDARVLVIDNMGMLSRLYYYATVTYVGGGFNKSGIHNTLEAVVYGKPVIFGPHYQKFREARELVECRGAVSINGQETLNKAMDQWVNDAARRNAAGAAAGQYVLAHLGATATIMKEIQENLLRTS